MRYSFVWVCSAMLLCINTSAFAQHTVIPAPVSYQVVQVQFVINENTTIVSAADVLHPLTIWFKEQLAHRNIVISNDKKSIRTIAMILAPPDKPLTGGEEAYRLEVTADKIEIIANQPAGVFYGMQTLLQMIPLQAEGNAVTIKGCVITDYPRFGWRGLMLDVSRHFFTVSEVKKYIDLMAQYKLNVLHWHLTDDQGWRIEIKSYPKLATTGGCRVVRHGTFGERIPPRPGEKPSDCNYYTQDQIKEIVAYANMRHVTIVPEIDVPGHSLAAIAAYPELSVTGQPQVVNPGSKMSEWPGDGTFTILVDNTLNPADEKVYTFLDKVFGEVAQLFPGTYIHAGGDECYYGYWQKSPQISAFMKQKGIKDMHGLQSYFMQRVASIIQSKGKQMIGWDEILEGGLASGAAVMSWRGMKGGIAAAKLGHAVVMSPTTHAYLDYMQADASLEPRVYDKLFLKTCYDFNPLPDGMDAKWLLGAQANLWTEKVPTFRHATYMTYPRAWAIAETVWSPVVQKNWSDFVRRTEAHFLRAETSGLHVSKALYDPYARMLKIGQDSMVQITCEHPDALIRYTLDGTHPDVFSPVYSEPFILPEGPVVLRSAAFLHGKQAGRVLILTKEELRKRK